MASSIPAPSRWPPLSLHNGYSLPSVGLGTFRTKDRETVISVIDTALKAGYRSFDTAAVYGIEGYIGEAFGLLLPKYELTREDIYVTSKLSNADHGSKKRVLNAFAKTEALLGFSPNMYMLHLPAAAKYDVKDQKNRMQRHIAWSALTKIYDEGDVESIGVSNFTKHHFYDLKQAFHDDIPVINQVEWHPLYHDDDLLGYCNENSIVLQGYHTLGGADHHANFFKNTVLKEIADDHSVGIAQALLTWSLQRGVAVIPKSVNPQHIADNIDLNFRLNESEMNKLNNFSLHQTKFAWTQESRIKNQKILYSVRPHGPY